MFVSDIKEKMMDLFPKDYKPKKISGTFGDNYIEYKSEGDEQLTIEQYLGNIRRYLHDMIDNFGTYSEWKKPFGNKN